MEYWSALVIGFLGSVHCVGMCGPLALALPGTYASRWRLLASRMLYNLGRAITYALMGGVIGLAGKSIAIVGTQQILAIIAGVAILLMVIMPSQWVRRLLPTGLSQKLNTLLSGRIGKLYHSGSQFALFGIGLLNGLLPCGFVYIGLAAAVAAGSVWGSATYMFFFGLGTIPLMLITSMFGRLLPVRAREWFSRAVPVFAIVLASLLILRGMGLGIKYISPDLSPKPASTAPPACH